MKTVFFNLVLAFSALVSGCGSGAAKQDSLRVGLSADFAPFAFIQDGEICGFDVDLMKEVAGRLGQSPTFQDLPFETLIPELATGKLQVVAGGMSPTPERGKRVLFSKVYLEGEPIIAVAKLGTPWIEADGLKNFQQAKIVVCMGYSSSDDYVTKKLQLEPIRLNNLMECLLALKTGQADVLVGPRLSLAPMLSQDPRAWQVHLFEGTQEQSALLLSKNETSLKELIDKALEAMEKEGVIDRLKAKWGIG